MMVPCVEGLKMDWTVDDALHSRFIGWRIKCENILDCQLAILQENTKCEQVIQWSGAAGLDMYISWNLPKKKSHCRPYGQDSMIFASHNPMQFMQDLTC